MVDDLGPRRAAILRAIVQEFVRTGEAVGSKHVVDRARLDVSPATVRNEMARLEDLGYLAQPHTSAGRVPTDLGYRFVVDAMGAPRGLTEDQHRALEDEILDGQPSIEELLRRAGDVVSRMTSHAAAILARRGRPSRLRHVELVPVGERVINVVLIAGNGRVEQRIVTLDQAIMPRDVERLGERLRFELHEVDLDAAVRTLGEYASTASGTERSLVEGIAHATQGLLDAEQHIILGGAGNLASEFEREEFTRLYDALERQSALLDAFAAALQDPAGIMIGSEIPGADFRQCSVVVANFETVGSGSVGVIGPTRMDYERVKTTTTAVAGILSDAIGSSDG